MFWKKEGKNVIIAQSGLELLKSNVNCIRNPNSFDMK